MRQAVQAREKQYHHLDQSPREGGMFELWEDGTLVEWELAVDLDGDDKTMTKVLLRNIDDKIID